MQSYRWDHTLLERCNGIKKKGGMQTVKYKQILLRVHGVEGESRGVLKWSSSHTHTTDPSSSATLLAGQGKHSCCLDDILYDPWGQAGRCTHTQKYTSDMSKNWNWSVPVWFTKNLNVTGENLTTWRYFYGEANALLNKAFNGFKHFHLFAHKPLYPTKHISILSLQKKAQKKKLNRLFIHEREK